MTTLQVNGADEDSPINHNDSDAESNPPWIWRAEPREPKEEDLIWISEGFSPDATTTEHTDLWMYRPPERDPRPGYLTLRFKAIFTSPKEKEIPPIESRIIPFRGRTYSHFRMVFSKLAKISLGSDLADSLSFYFGTPEPGIDGRVVNTIGPEMPSYYMDVRVKAYMAKVWAALKEILWKTRDVMFKYLGDEEGQGHIVPDAYVLSRFDLPDCHRFIPNQIHEPTYDSFLRCLAAAKESWTTWHHRFPKETKGYVLKAIAGLFEVDEAHQDSSTRKWSRTLYIIYVVSHSRGCRRTSESSSSREFTRLSADATRDRAEDFSPLSKGLSFVQILGNIHTQRRRMHLQEM